MIPSHLPVLRLVSADGAQATIALDGAHVTSWTPAGANDDRLFVSERSAYGPGQAIRGGIPVIFPQFGLFGSLPQHGFARNCRWTVLESLSAPGRATLHLADDDSTRAAWPHAFDATLVIEVAGKALSVSMTILNRGNTPFDFTAAFHPYFAVRDAVTTRVEGLAGCRYRDSLRDGSMFVEPDSILHIDGPINRIYYEAPDRLVIVDGDRTLTIEKSGFPEAVVWNPGAEGTRERSDFAPGDEVGMLCVEAAVIQHPVTLAPGASWTGVQRMTAS